MAEPSFSGELVRFESSWACERMHKRMLSTS